MITYKIEFMGYGGEFYYGLIKDENDRKQLIQLFENGELDIYHENLEFWNFDDIISAYGPAINGDFRYTVTNTATDKINYESENDTDIDVLEKVFTLENPSISTYNAEDYDANPGDIAFGGIAYEKNIMGYIDIDIGADEEFNPDFLYFGVINMDETLSDDEIIVKAYYLNNITAKNIEEHFNKNNIYPDFIENIENAFLEKNENVLNILKEQELYIEDMEGTPKSSYAFITDEEFIQLTL
jgi:hypothetical protein